MVMELELSSGLSLEQAWEKYEEVKEGFEKIRSLYSGLYDGFRRRDMKKEDQTLLYEYMGVLLRLDRESSVQDAFTRAKQSENITRITSGSLVGITCGQTLYELITDLNLQIADYALHCNHTEILKLLGCKEI